MMTEGFKPLYPAMCVSLRHLQRCQHGAKFKSSNYFCPTLYIIFHPQMLMNAKSHMHIKLKTKIFVQRTDLGTARNDLIVGKPKRVSLK
jgi:hypothetical protein